MSTDQKSGDSESAGGLGNESAGNPEGPENADDAQLRSAEAMRYRQQLRETQAALADVTATNAALLRRDAETQLAGKLRDPSDLWIGTNLDDITGEDGLVDNGLLNTRADELLAEHPHWASPTTHPQAGLVNSAGIVGGTPRSVLDADNVRPAPPVRGWAAFMQDGAAGGTPPQQ